MSRSNVSTFLTCIVAAHCRSVHMVFPSSIYLDSHSCQGETIRQKLDHLSRLIMMSGPRPSFDFNPQGRPDCLLATHPSDHNAVHVKNFSNKGNERENKIQKRKKRDGKKSEQEKPSIKDFKHEDAFLVPVPTYYGYGASCSGIAGVVTLCVAVGGFLSRHFCSRFLIIHFNRVGAGELVMAEVILAEVVLVEAVMAEVVVAGVCLAEVAVGEVAVGEVAAGEAVDAVDHDLDCESLKSQRRQAVGTQL